MRKTKRTKSHLESPECCDTSAFSFKIKALSLEAQNLHSPDLKRHIFPSRLESIEEFLKNYQTCRTSSSGKSYANIRKTPKEILDVNTSYAVHFSTISYQIEKWSSQRRKTLREIERISKSIEQIKSNCSKGRLVFSAVDIAGTLGSSILDSLHVSWSPKVLFTSAAFGCFSLVCSLFEMSHMKSHLEKALQVLTEDKDLQRTLEMSFHKMGDFDRSINELFPYGVDSEVVRALQNNGGDMCDVVYGIEDLLKVMPSSTTNKRIWLAVLLSNAIKDLKLLEDEDFLEKADEFSKSRVAEIWWKRMQYKVFPSLPKSELEAELRSCLKHDSMPFHAVPLVSAPFWYGNALHTVGSLLTNSLVVFDAYCELSGHERTKEEDALRELKKNLQMEYDDVMSLYEKLNPYYD